MAGLHSGLEARRTCFQAAMDVVSFEGVKVVKLTTQREVELKGG